MAIYENIKKAAKEKGLTIVALEEQLDFPRGSISKWDINKPGVLKVYAVAKALDKPIEYFLEEGE